MKELIAPLCILAAIAALVVALIVINGACWQYAINAWLVFFEKETAIKLWQACIVGLIPGLGQAGIPVAGVTWIIMLFA